MNKSRLVLDLLLIGRESGASFVNQSQRVKKQNQSKRGVLSMAFFAACDKSSCPIVQAICWSLSPPVRSASHRGWYRPACSPFGKGAILRLERVM